MCFAHSVYRMRKSGRRSDSASAGLRRRKKLCTRCNALHSASRPQGSERAPSLRFLFTKQGSWSTMKQLQFVLNNQKMVLDFLKSRFRMYDRSNFFFRDIQYGIQQFLKEKGMKAGYAESEAIAWAFAESLEKAKIFRPIDAQSWTVNYPEFRTPQVKAAATSQAPAAAASPSPRPATS